MTIAVVIPHVLHRVLLRLRDAVKREHGFWIFSGELIIIDQIPRLCGVHEKCFINKHKKQTVQRSAFYVLSEFVYFSWE